MSVEWARRPKRDAYHVEANDGCSILLLIRRPGISHHASSGSGQDGSQTTELVVAHQTSVGLHELDPRVSVCAGLEALQEAANVLLSLGGEVCVRRSGVTAMHQLDDGQEIVGKRDVPEAYGSGKLAYPLLML